MIRGRLRHDAAESKNADDSSIDRFWWPILLALAQLRDRKNPSPLG